MIRRIRSLIHLFRTHREVWWIIAYMVIYIGGFRIMENARHVHYHVIHTWLDEQIPFCEYFIVPYLLWFVYIGSAALYFFLRERDMYFRLVYTGMVGMTIFLLISWLYPNGLELRPETFARDNVFVTWTEMVYANDTPTNVLPSIHVFNSVGTLFAVRQSRRLRDRHVIKAGAHILTLLIILSTMFLKQHSIVDVLLALVISYLAYELIYDNLYDRAVFVLRRQVNALKTRRSVRDLH